MQDSFYTKCLQQRNSSKQKVDSGSPGDGRGRGVRNEVTSKEYAVSLVGDKNIPEVDCAY